MNNHQHSQAGEQPGNRTPGQQYGRTSSKQYSKADQAPLRYAAALVFPVSITQRSRCSIWRRRARKRRSCLDGQSGSERFINEQSKLCAGPRESCSQLPGLTNDGEIAERLTEKVARLWIVANRMHDLNIAQLAERSPIQAALSTPFCDQRSIARRKLFGSGVSPACSRKRIRRSITYTLPHRPAPMMPA